MTKTRKCRICNKTKPIEKFWKRKLGKDGIDYNCSECTQKNVQINYQLRKDYFRGKARERHYMMKEFITGLKKELKCIKCGESRYYVLDFHHLDPSTKEFTIGEATTKGKEATLIEMKKCIPLCRNCHAEYHHLNRENKHEGKEEIKIEEYLKLTFILENPGDNLRS